MAELSHHEPSMEEILASIKRVIAEDRPPAPPRARVRPDAALARDGAEVLELDRAVPGGEPLVSPRALDATRGSFAALAAAVPEPVAAGDGPLEAVVREMLRPMLRAWLDERLPGLVEELVMREIGRITGRKL